MPRLELKLKSGARTRVAIKIGPRLKIRIRNSGNVRIRTTTQIRIKTGINY